MSASKAPIHRHTITIYKQQYMHVHDNQYIPPSLVALSPKLYGNKTKIHVKCEWLKLK
jgi:hypothetical protein